MLENIKMDQHHVVHPKKISVTIKIAEIQR